MKILDARVIATAWGRDSDADTPRLAKDQDALHGMAWTLSA
ncbi:hypothetical protein [Sphingomonas sp. PWP1-2]